MDPVSAFALACNAMQVVELSIKTAKVCKEIFDSGSLSEHDDLESYAKELSASGAAMAEQLASTRLGPREVRIKQIINESEAISKELTNVLRQLRLVGRQNKGRLLIQSIRTLAKRHSIEKLQLRLEKHDALLNSVILKELYRKCGEQESQHSAAFNKLNTNQQELIKSYARIQSSVDQNHLTLMKKTERSEQAIVNAIENTNEKAKILRIQDDVRRSIAFPEMSARQNMVQQRVGEYGDTFQWIFAHSGNTARYRSTTDPGFVEWLEAPQTTSIFWLSGKPGSGKSSMMNYIQQELSHGGIGESYLQIWDTAKSCRILRHFFYRPGGSHLQKSLEGMLRTLCLQLLEADPGFFYATHSLPPRLRAQISVMSSVTTWLLQDLRDLFEHVLQRAVSRTKHVLLVDGIDETADEQESIATYLQYINGLHENIKICCASRPELSLSNIFKECRSLKIQDFNRQDMYKFCRRKLADTRAASLSNMIVEKADGVFLWVCLVANDLRRSASYEDENELKDRLKCCPGDIFALFSHMLQNIDPQHRRKPEPFLAIVYGYHQRKRGPSRPHTLLLLLAAAHGNKVSHRGRLDTDDKAAFSVISRQCAVAQERIIAHTAGLIEPFDINIELKMRLKGDVEFESILSALCTSWRFIHRSAIDFLSESMSAEAVGPFFSWSTAEVHERIAQAEITATKTILSVAPEIFAYSTDRTIWFAQHRICEDAIESVESSVGCLLHDHASNFTHYQILDKAYEIKSCIYTQQMEKTGASSVLLDPVYLDYVLQDGMKIQTPLWVKAAMQPALYHYCAHKLTEIKDKYERSQLMVLTVLVQSRWKLWEPKHESYFDILESLPYDSIDAKYPVKLAILDLIQDRRVMGNVKAQYILSQAAPLHVLLALSLGYLTEQENGIVRNIQLAYALRWYLRFETFDRVEFPLSWLIFFRGERTSEREIDRVPIMRQLPKLADFDYGGSTGMHQVSLTEVICEITSILEYVDYLEKGSDIVRLNDLLRFYVTRASPFGTTRYLPVSTEEEIDESEPAFPFLKYGSDDWSSILDWHREILIRHADEFSRVEKQMINEWWERSEMPFPDEIGHENSEEYGNKDKASSDETEQNIEKV